MKIAIDIREAAGEKAGKGWYTFNIVKNLLEIDQKNSYILYSKNPIPGIEDFKNAEIKIIKSPSIFWHKKVAKDIQKENVDVFFAPTSYIIPSLLPENIKSIITVHDLVAFLFPKNHNKKAVILEKIFLKKALKRASHIVTVSKNTKNDLIEKFAATSGKITVIPCAASDEFKQIPKENLTKFIKDTNLPDKFFLAVGTIIPRKNYKNLIKAFVKINKEFPAQNLIIVGNKGSQYEEIAHIIDENYLRENVHVLGYLSNNSLVNLYNLAEALVFPSFYEGFGIPPLEAFTCGCPVIASNTSSIPEVVGEAALLIDPESIDEIASAMRKIIVDENLREDLKNKGFIQAKKFSWKKSAEELLKIFIQYSFE